MCSPLREQATEYALLVCPLLNASLVSASKVRMVLSSDAEMMWKRGIVKIESCIFRSVFCCSSYIYSTDKVEIYIQGQAGFGNTIIAHVR